MNYAGQGDVEYPTAGKMHEVTDHYTVVTTLVNHNFLHCDATNCKE